VEAEAEVGAAAEVVAASVVAAAMGADLGDLAGEAPVAVGPQAVGSLIMKMQCRIRRTIE
jgi:hypothetical protein